MSEFKSIVSSNLKEAAYDPATETLVVRFRNETAYQYPKVSPGFYAQFEKTFDGKDGNSAGRFFHAHIRNLPCEKVEE